MGRPSIESLAATRRRPTKCMTCKMPKVVRDVRSYLRVRLKLQGRCRLSYNGFYLEMVERHGYSLGYTTLYRHIRECEAELYGQITAQGF